MTKKRREFDLGVKLRETTSATTEQGELRVDSADNKLKAFLDSAERALLSEDQTQTLTNKTIDADNNTISELEVDNLKSGVLDEDLSSVSASHDTIPSALAVKTYVDDSIALKDQAAEISYDNATSGLTATDVQAAIDEVEGRVDTIESTAKVDSFNTRTGAVVPAASDYDADQVDYTNTTSGLTATDVQAAIDEVEGRVDTLEGDTTLSDHLNGGASKHDATEVDYERVDGSKKNIDAASDDAESAITDLDDAIGALDATPTNYTASDVTIVADHLAGIDSALATAGADEKADDVFRVVGSVDSSKKMAFEVDGFTTSTTRTITPLDADMTLVGESNTQTLTNKTLDADNNTVSNLEVDNLKSGVLDTDLSTVSASHDTLPSAKSVKDYVDSEIALKDQAAEISYDNTTSGLVATDVQAAIDEVEGRVDTLEGSSGSIIVEEQDGTPSVDPTSKIKFPNGSVTDEGSGVVSVVFGDPLTVQGTTPDVTVSSVSTIEFPDDMVTDGGSGKAIIDPTALIQAQVNQITEWETVSGVTGSWTTNTTYNVKQKRIGDSAVFHYNLTLSGAPNSTFCRPNVPSGLTIDTSKTPSIGGAAAVVGYGMCIAGGARHEIQVLYNGSQFLCRPLRTNIGIYATNGDDVNQSTPGTFGSGDNVQFVTMPLPITEWAGTTERVVTESDNVSPSIADTTISSSWAHNTTTFIGFTSTESDDDSLFTNMNTASNTTYTNTLYWTCPKSGYYLVDGQIVISDADVDDGEVMELSIYEDGSTVRAQTSIEQSGSPSSPVFPIQVTKTIYIEEGKDISLGIFHFTNGSLSPLTTSKNSWFSIVRQDKSPLIALGNETTWIKDKKTEGTSGGSSVATGVVTRDLNSITGSTTHVSLSSNQVTLQPGTYDIYFSAPGFRCDGMQAYWYNTSDSAVSIEGGNAFSKTTETDYGLSIGGDVLTITSAKTYELRMYTEVATATIGLGAIGASRTSNPLTTEIYSQVKIVKLK